MDSVAVLADRRQMNDNLASDLLAEVPGHLTSLFESSCEHLSTSEKEILAALLRSFGDVFSTGDRDIGITFLTEHHIATGNAPPIWQRPRRVPLSQREVADMEVDKNCEGVYRLPEAQRGYHEGCTSSSPHRG